MAGVQGYLVDRRHEISGLRRSRVVGQLSERLVAGGGRVCSRSKPRRSKRGESCDAPFQGRKIAADAVLVAQGRFGIRTASGSRKVGIRPGRARLIKSTSTFATHPILFTS